MMPTGDLPWLASVPSSLMSAIGSAPADPSAIPAWIGRTIAVDPWILEWLARYPDSLGFWVKSAPTDLWTWLAAMPRD